MARNLNGRWRLKLISAALAACFAQGAAALPTAPSVVNGTATFTQTGNALTVTNSDRAIINWNSFSIGGNESVRFLQPSTSSSVLNRVLAADPSVLLGALTSNGKVFLINPAGILVGAGARIDTAGFVASTLNLSNADFLANRFSFVATPGAGAVKVEKGAEIKTASGGQVYLVAPQVENSGVITTPGGEIILAAGSSVELVDTGTPGVKVSVVASNEQAINLGQLVAESGRIGMVGAVVKQQGTASTSSLVREGGRIFLKATQSVELATGSQTLADGTQGGMIEVNGGGTTLVSGDVSATGSTGSGGRVELLGDKVGVLAGANVDASGETGGGTVLVGGDYQGKNASVRNAAITYLAEGATVRADARGKGDGGKVIFWADDTTRAYGTISARGGKTGGNGGFVEVSGKKSLAFDAVVDTSAARGLTGTLLLDPNSVTIYNGPATPIGGATWTESGGGSTLQWSTIDSQLQSTNVTIMTTNSGGAGDDIIVSNAYGPMSASATSTHTLILNANDQIVFNTNLDLKGGLQATAGGDINVNSIVRTAGSQTINGWNINVSAAANAAGLEMTNAAGSQSVTAGGSLNVIGSSGAGAGAYIKSAGSQSVTAAAISLSGGISFATNSATIEAIGSQSITTTSGDLTLSGSTNAKAKISSDTSQTISVFGDAFLTGGAGASAGAAMITAPVQNISIGGDLTLTGGSGLVLDAYGLAAVAAIGYDAGADITLNVGGSVLLNGNNAINPAMIGAAVGSADVYLRGTDITLDDYSYVGNWDASTAGGTATLVATGSGIVQTSLAKLKTGDLTATANGNITLDGANIADSVDLTAGGVVSYHSANPSTTKIGAESTGSGNITIVGDAGSTSIQLVELRTSGAGTVTVSAQGQVLEGDWYGNSDVGVADIIVGTGAVTLTSVSGTTAPGTLAISADIDTNGGTVNATVSGGAYSSIGIRDVGNTAASSVTLTASSTAAEGDVGYFRIGDLNIGGGTSLTLTLGTNGSTRIGATGDVQLSTSLTMTGADAELFAGGDMTFAAGTLTMSGDGFIHAGGNLSLTGGNVSMQGATNGVFAGGTLSIASAKTLTAGSGSLYVGAGSIVLNGTLSGYGDTFVHTLGGLTINSGGLHSTNGNLDFIVGGPMKVVGNVSAGGGIIGDVFGSLTLGEPLSGTGVISAGGGAVDLVVGETGIAMYNGSHINSTDPKQPGGGLITLFFPGLSAGGSIIDGVATFEGGYRLNGTLTALGQGLEVSYGILSSNLVSDAIVAATTSSLSSGGGTSQTDGSLALISTAPAASGGEATQTIGGTTSSFGSSEAGASGDGSTTTTQSGQNTGGKQEEKTNAKKKPAQCTA